METADKKIWIDEVMASTKGMTPLPPDAMLYKKVMDRINSQTGSNDRKILLTRSATAAVLLLVINVLSIVHYTKKVNSNSKQNVYEELNTEYRALSEN